MTNLRKAERPTCINPGCEKGVIPSVGKISDPNPKWRPVCGHCQKASYGKHPYAYGVRPFYSGICSNIDGHLGWECWTDFDKMPDDFKKRTEADPIDGDPTNNDPSNLQELCSSCHSYKGQKSGDHNGHRSTSIRVANNVLLFQAA